MTDNYSVWGAKYQLGDIVKLAWAIGKFEIIEITQYAGGPIQYRVSFYNGLSVDISEIELIVYENDILKLISRPPQYTNQPIQERQRIEIF